MQFNKNRYMRIKAANNNNSVYTIIENCIGCNKCIAVCPVKFANVVNYSESGKKNIVNSDRCIQCGNCIKACDHNARDYCDDTKSFFSDLKKGEKFTVIVSSLIAYDFENYNKVFNFLRQIGVNLIIDESIGLDINTWRYLKLIEDKDGTIPQISPVTVNFIEKYVPESIGSIAQSQSPTLCTAIYLRKYLNNTDKLAFLSPYIAKNIEFMDVNQDISIYNVTFKKLAEYLNVNNINLNLFEDSDFDNLKNQDIELFTKKEIEATNNSKFKYGKLIPKLTNLIYGEDDSRTGMIDNLDERIVSQEIYLLKQAQLKNRAELLSHNCQSSFEFFDKTLDFQDFKRIYQNKSGKCQIKETDLKELNVIFNNLYMTTEKEQKINCCFCGYYSCREMAKAIYNGINDYKGCMYYLEKQREKENKELADKNEEIQLINEGISQILVDATNMVEEKENNERKIKSILDSLIDAVIVINDKKEIVSSNLSVKSLFGFSPDKLEGHNISMLIPDINSILADFVDSPDKSSFCGKLIDSKIETKALKSDNSFFDVEIGFNDLELDYKKVYICVIRNISKRKEIERLKNQFVSTTSHELRTPLTSIKGALGLILSGAFGCLSEEITDLLNIANNNCQRQICLINDLLDIEKIRAGKIDFNFVNIELGTIIDQAINANSAFAKQYKVEYKLGDMVPDAIINVDINRFIQVLTNVLSNAAKFSHQNGIVTISVNHIQDRLRISVIDQGIGIDEKFKKHVFSDFTQADSTDTRKKGGTGLGLSISKSIIEKMNGEISFISKLGEGSTFYIDIEDRSSKSAEN